MTPYMEVLVFGGKEAGKSSVTLQARGSLVD
jgi:hypothetical protein